MTGSRKLLALGFALWALVCGQIVDLSDEARKDFNWSVVALFAGFCGANAWVHKVREDQSK